MTAIEVKPIATAPVRAGGAAFGPCLLFPGLSPGGEWTLGAWNGRQWHDLSGELLDPAAWAALPPHPGPGAAASTPSELHRRDVAMDREIDIRRRCRL